MAFPVVVSTDLEGIGEKIQAKISFYHAGKFQPWEIWCPSSATLYGRKRRRRRWRKQDRDARYVLSSVKTLLQTISQTWATSFTVNLYCSSTWLQLEVQIFCAEALRSSCLTCFFFIHNFRFDPDTPCLPPPPPHPWILHQHRLYLSFSWDECNTLEELETNVMHFLAGEEANEVYDGTEWRYQNWKCDLRQIFFPFVRKASQI